MINSFKIFGSTGLVSLLFLLPTTPAFSQQLGIVGKPAPSWKTSSWHQLPKGKTKLDVSDYNDKILYLYFFQSWCPGCHSSGFPTLKKLTEAFAGEDGVAFVTIQTTFEGHSINTADKLAKTAERYKLSIPFGQSAGRKGMPDLMKQYRTGGTPWVVLIEPGGRVVFNNFHADAQKAEVAIKAMLEDLRSKKTLKIVKPASPTSPSSSSAATSPTPPASKKAKR